MRWIQEVTFISKRDLTTEEYGEHRGNVLPMRRGGQAHSMSIRIWSDGVRGCFNTLIRSKRTELSARYFDGPGNRPIMNRSCRHMIIEDSRVTCAAVQYGLSAFRPRDRMEFEPLQLLPTLFIREKFIRVLCRHRCTATVKIEMNTVPEST